jgi:hypothetical protein
LELLAELVPPRTNATCELLGYPMPEHDPSKQLASISCWTLGELRPRKIAAQKPSQIYLRLDVKWLKHKPKRIAIGQLAKGKARWDTTKPLKDIQNELRKKFK